MLSVIVKWSKVNIQIKTDILQKQIDVFVCVSPSLNRCILLKYSHMDCNEEVLNGPHTSTLLHDPRIPRDTDQGVVGKPLPEQKVMPYFGINL